MGNIHVIKAQYCMGNISFYQSNTMDVKRTCNIKQNEWEHTGYPDTTLNVKHACTTVNVEMSDIPVNKSNH